MDIRMPRQFTRPSRLLAVALVLCTGLIAVPVLAPAPAQAYDCAHGPDTWRVRGVASWDKLNMRAGPAARYGVVGRIDALGSGVHCLGPCKRNWCRVSWRGMTGWVNMRYLGE